MLSWKTTIKEDITMTKKSDGQMTNTLEQTCEEMNSFRKSSLEPAPALQTFRASVRRNLQIVNLTWKKLKTY